MSSHNEIAAQARTREVGDRALAAWEIVSIVSSVLIAEWILTASIGWNRFVGAVPIGLALVFMIASHRERRETLTDLGFRIDNFTRAVLLLILPMLILTSALLIIAWISRSGTNFLRWAAGTPLVLRLLLGIGWGLLQQYVLQGFVNRRAIHVFGRGWPSVLLVAAIFAGLHLPNLWLTVITFVGGGVWAAVYQRAPNLFALAISHSLMTWVVISTIPGSVLHHLRIGFGYFL